jgi:hypothetical protein
MAKLIVESGPQRLSDLARSIECRSEQIGYLLSGPWFCRTGYGTYGLTKMGREEYDLNTANTPDA